jgi:hypothetical protein
MIADFPHESDHSQRAICSLLKLAIEYSNGFRDGNCLHWMDLIDPDEIGKALKSPNFEVNFIPPKFIIYINFPSRE